ncbi:hypothetical protein K502DRAFT_364545 [Neoconidiobolus thromboides FSU 785]|nr:hypothetical protein K502DRAFT_364545 [Neoconidiobolus thromboides FSU 785]
MTKLGTGEGITYEVNNPVFLQKEVINSLLFIFTVNSLPADTATPNKNESGAADTGSSSSVEGKLFYPYGPYPYGGYGGYPYGGYPNNYYYNFYQQPYYYQYQNPSLLGSIFG